MNDAIFNFVSKGLNRAGVATSGVQISMKNGYMFVNVSKIEKALVGAAGSSDGAFLIDHVENTQTRSAFIKADEIAFVSMSGERRNY